MNADMFLPMFLAGGASPDVEPQESGSRRKRKHRADRRGPQPDERQTPAHQQGAAANGRPRVPPVDASRNPLLLDRKLQLPRLPFIAPAAKKAALQDLQSRNLSLPLIHPRGPSHPRVYTLIRLNDSRPLRSRGSPPTPSGRAQGVLARRAAAPPLPTPAATPQTGPSRSERRQDRMEPYADGRRTRARGA